MTSPKSSYRSASHRFDVITPAKGVAYLIDKIDWEHIKACLTKIKSDAPIFSNLAAVFGGAFLSALLAVITARECQKDDLQCALGNSNTFTYMAVSLLLAIVCFIFSRRLKAQDRSSVEDLTSFMTNVEKKLDK